MYGGTFLGGGRRLRRGGADGDEPTPRKKKTNITRKPSKQQITSLQKLQDEIDAGDLARVDEISQYRADSRAKMEDAPTITPVERARLMREALGIKPKKPRAKPTAESRAKRADAKIRRETRQARKNAIIMYDAMTPEEQADMTEEQYQEIRNEIYKDKTEKGLNLRNRILGHSGYTDAKGRVIKPTRGYTGDGVRMSEADKNDLSMWLYERGYGNGGAILQGGAIFQGSAPLGGRRGGEPLGGQILGGEYIGGRRRRGGVPMGGAWYDDLWSGIKSIAPAVLPLLL